MNLVFTRRLIETTVGFCNAVGDEFFPLLVWLAVFGATRLVPSLTVRMSMAVPQTMDVPPVLPWSADELSARLADLINSTPSGTSSSSGTTNTGFGGVFVPGTTSSSWTRFSRRISEALLSLVTYPQRLAVWLLFQRSQRPALRADAAARQGRPVVVQLLLRLVTSFTSTWVHASGKMLFDTVITYLSTRLGSWGSNGAAGFVLGMGGPGRATSLRLSSGWRDLFVASCVSTGLNYLLQTYWIDTLTSAGELRALAARRRPSSSSTSPSFRTGTTGGTSSGSGNSSSNADYDESSATFTHMVLSTFSRLGGKDTLYRLGRMMLRPQSSSPSDAADTSTTASTVAPSARTATSAVSSAASPAASAKGTDLAPPLARVYLCGGNSFVFALSGFRFAFYGDGQQLTTAVSNCVTDALDLLFRQARQRAAAQAGRVVSPYAHGQVWRPPPSTWAAGTVSSYDVVLAPAASLQLLPIYVMNFAVGAGMGMVWRERLMLIAFGRRIPFVRDALEVLLPLPPAPLRLPEALQELSPECHILLIYEGGHTEVVAEDAVAPLTKEEGEEARQRAQPAEASTNAAPATTTTTNASAPPRRERPPRLNRPRSLNSSTRSLAASMRSLDASTSSRPGSLTWVNQEGEAAAASPPPPRRPSSTAPVRARVAAAQDLFCPIKRTLMSDPVRTVDGFTYDRDGIEEWLRVHDTAPLTNLHLDSAAVQVNWVARRQIEQLVDQYHAAVRVLE